MVLLGLLVLFSELRTKHIDFHSGILSRHPMFQPTKLESERQLFDMSDPEVTENPASSTGRCNTYLIT